MFERLIQAVLTEGIETLNESPAFLRKLLAIPGRSEEETDKLVELWTSEKGAPQIVHGYPRISGRFPCYAIVLSGEGTKDEYLGDASDLSTAAVAEAQQYVAEVEAALGRPVEAAVSRWMFTYSIFTYTEHPDVTLAYYQLLRSIFMGSKRRMLQEGFELTGDPFQGMDMAPDPRYQPENVFIRQFNITGHAHLLFSYDLNLGPFQSGRARKLARAHVADHVLGVDPGITTPGQDSED